MLKISLFEKKIVISHVEISAKKWRFEDEPFRLNGTLLFAMMLLENHILEK